MKATRTIELAKGVVITVVAELREYHTEGDAWEGRVAEHKAWVSTEITLEMNGKKFKSDSGFTSDENYITKVLKLDDSIKAHSLFRDKTGKAIAINLKAENAEKVLAAIEEAKADVTTDEVKACKKAETEVADKEERAEAQAVIEAAERVINNGNKLRTNAERKVWERNYNNAMNEGGEGYVPHYPSVEEYEAAKARLNR